MAIERQMAFSYASLAPDVRARVETATRRLHDLERRTSESIIEMGQHLIDVKAEIGHGNFLPWLKAEFGWSERTAQNIMSVAEAFGGEYETVSHLGAKVLYALSAPSTPDNVRIEFTELAKMGQHFTHKAVKDRIDEVNSRADNAPPRNTATVDRDTVEIVDDDEPIVEGEYVDANDPAVRLGWDMPAPQKAEPAANPKPARDYTVPAKRLADQIEADYGIDGGIRVLELAATMLEERSEP